MSRSRRLSIYLAAFCLACAACGGGDDGDDDAGPRPTTTAPQTTQPQDQADEEALRQLAEDWYETYNQIFEARTDGQEAEDFLIDPYLSQFRAQVSDYLATGNQTTRSERSSQTIEEVSIDRDSGVVTECVVNANVLVGDDGTVLNDEVAVRRIETRASRMADGWRFAERSVLEELDGEQCDT